MWLFTLVSWLWGGKFVSGETIPGAERPNRSREARVKASSYRAARLEEIPTPKGVAAKAVVAIPHGWPRWGPRYARDGSPLTKWASEAGEHHWLELNLANPLRPRVPVAALTISWAALPSGEVRIMSSPDGIYWKQAAKAGTNRLETIAFEPPLLAAALRIEVSLAKSAGVEIVDLGVYGPGSEAAPGPVKGLTATAEGPDCIRLRWWPAAEESTYFYRIYRAEGRPPRLDAEHLIETVAADSFADYGLRPGRTYHYAVAAESFGGLVSAPVETVAATAEGREFYRFQYRGIVEGFYNDPWPHQERLRMIAFLEDIGFNYYIYAPKMEPFHRQWWFKPYPEAELRNFAELAAACRAHGITFNYGISPGLDMDYTADRDIEVLKTKLKSIFDQGVRAFTICLDDIPEARSAGRGTAQAQVQMVNEVYAFLQSLDPGVELFFTPTVYSRTYAHYREKGSPKAGYLEALAGLSPGIGILWTGPGEVFSRKISREAAGELKKLWGRPVLIWDNYPVNDILLRYNIFTGPYLGRAPDLGEAVAGIFLNPMYLPHASRIALFTAGVYMREENYDPWVAYERALRFLGGSEAGFRALKTISDCLLPHPVFPQLGLEEVPIYLAMEDFWATQENKTLHAAAEKKLRQMFSGLASNPEDLARHLPDAELAAELMPASQKLSLYGQAGLKCLDSLRESDPGRIMVLRREIVELQARARLIPWHVVDERTSLPMVYVGVKLGSRNALDDFITRALAALPR